MNQKVQDFNDVNQNGRTDDYVMMNKSKVIGVVPKAFLEKALEVLSRYKLELL